MCNYMPDSTVRKLVSFEAFLGVWDLISILLNSKQLDTRAISSLQVTLNIIEGYPILNSICFD